MLRFPFLSQKQFLLPLRNAKNPRSMLLAVFLRLNTHRFLEPWISPPCQQAVRLLMSISLRLLPNDGNTPYCLFHAPSSDRFRSSFEELPKPGICIRVSVNETWPRNVFLQGNGIYFAARLFCNGTKYNIVSIQSRRTDCVRIFFLRCASSWHMDSNAYSELPPRSLFQITLPFEKRT